MAEDPRKPPHTPSRSGVLASVDPSLLVAALGGILFLAVLVDVQAGGFLSSRVDPWVRSVFGFQGGLLYQTAAVLTHVGGWWILAPVGVLAAYIPLRDRRIAESMVIASSFVAQAGLVQLTKFLVSRARPGVDASLDAFPSGHAANGLLVWGLLLLVAIPGGTRDKRAWAIFVPVAFLAGFTRILIDVHWATDVLAGWSLAIAWLATTTAVRARLAPAPGPGFPTSPPASRVP